MILNSKVSSTLPWFNHDFYFKLGSLEHNLYAIEFLFYFIFNNG